MMFGGVLGVGAIAGLPIAQASIREIDDPRQHKTVTTYKGKKYSIMVGQLEALKQLEKKSKNLFLLYNEAAKGSRSKKKITSKIAKIESKQSAILASKNIKALT